MSISKNVLVSGVVGFGAVFSICFAATKQADISGFSGLLLGGAIALSVSASEDEKKIAKEQAYLDEYSKETLKLYDAKVKELEIEVDELEKTSPAFLIKYIRHIDFQIENNSNKAELVQMFKSSRIKSLKILLEMMTSYNYELEVILQEEVEE